MWKMDTDLFTGKAWPKAHSCPNPAQAVPRGQDKFLEGDFNSFSIRSEPLADPPYSSCVVHDGGSEPRILANGAGCELAGAIHLRDAIQIDVSMSSELTYIDE